MSTVLVGANEGIAPADLAARIRAETGLEAMQPWDYSMRTLGYWMRETGIPINFGIAIALGFFVGVAIAGQMFYNFTLDNLRYFGAFKAMGASSRLLLSMVALQALVAGILGLGLGLSRRRHSDSIPGSPNVKSQPRARARPRETTGACTQRCAPWSRPPTAATRAAGDGAR